MTYRERKRHRRGRRRSKILLALLVLAICAVIAVLAFFFVANYTLSFTSLFVLRRRQPESPRPYRAIGHPFTTALALIASVAFLIGAIASDTRNSVYALVLLAVSFPIYLLFRRRRQHELPI